MLVLQIILISVVDILPQNRIHPPGCEWQEVEHKSYGPGDLFNYINGGAELFLEFGFVMLDVRIYRRNESEISLNIYRMELPESALGIYLYKCGSETPIKGISDRNSGGPYQISAVREKFFIQVNNFDGNKANIPAMIKAIENATANMPENRPVAILNNLPDENIIPGSKRIIRGQYGLQPIYTFGRGDILQLRGKVFAVLADYKSKIGTIYTHILVRYPSEESAISAFKNLILNLDEYSSIIHKGDRGFSFKDFQEEYGHVYLKKNFLEILIHLTKLP